MLRKNTWNYQGDVNLEHGGVFIKFDEVQAWYIEVVPATDMGGPDNLFVVLKGTLDPEPGFDPETLFDMDKHPYQQDWVMIGKPDLKHDSGWSTSGFDYDNPDYLHFRGGSKLKNIIRKEFFHY